MKFDRTNVILFVWVIVLPFLYYINIGGLARYYYESSPSYDPTFFTDITVIAENKKGDYEEFFAEEYKLDSRAPDKKVVSIPPKYKKYTFRLYGRVLNGPKDVDIAVNGEPVRVETSAFQGNRCFWESIYLEKNFSAELELKPNRNSIVVKSGERKSTIAVIFSSREDS